MSRSRKSAVWSRPLRQLHCVSADGKGTPEVHGKMDLSKHMRFQSVRLVGAVGIEPTTFGLKGRCSTTELRPYLLSSVYRETVWRASRLAHISFRIDRIVYGGFG